MPMSPLTPPTVLHHLGSAYMPPFPPSTLLRRLAESRLLEAAQVEAVRPLLPNFAD
jgi:hypothetical protein